MKASINWREQAWKCRQIECVPTVSSSKEVGYGRQVQLSLRTRDLSSDRDAPGRYFLLRFTAAEARELAERLLKHAEGAL